MAHLCDWGLNGEYSGIRFVGIVIRFSSQVYVLLSHGSFAISVILLVVFNVAVFGECCEPAGVYCQMGCEQ